MSTSYQEEQQSTPNPVVGGDFAPDAPEATIESAAPSHKDTPATPTPTGGGNSVPHTPHAPTPVNGSENGPAEHKLERRGNNSQVALVKPQRPKGALRRMVRILSLFGGFMWQFTLLRIASALRGRAYVKARQPKIFKKQAVKFRITAIQMGGLLIKLGQFLSSRVDILPREYIDELTKLQDEVPAVSFNLIRTQLEQELARPLSKLFSDFAHQPVAAASLGQVHFATLHSGEEVAVKVQRPGIEGIIQVDLAAFQIVVKALKRFTDWDRFVDLQGIYVEFKRTLGEELDYEQEAKNAERFKENFATEPMVSVPSVYWTYTSRRVLVEGRISGFKITDFAAIDAAGLKRPQIVQLVIRAYLKQIVEDGFFHADPHPGNLFVTPEGKLGFVDFGMMGEITPFLRTQFRQGVQAVVRRDASLLLDALVKLGFVHDDVDLGPLRRSIAIMLDRVHGVSWEAMEGVNFRGLADDMRELLYSEPFEIPAKYTFLGRALITLVGICLNLDPEVNLLTVVKPYASKLLSEGAKSVTESILSEAQTTGTILLQLPKLLESTLRQAQEGAIRVKNEPGPERRAAELHQRLANRLVWSILLAGSGISSVLLYTNHLLQAAEYTLGAAGLFALGLLWNARPRRRKTGGRHRGDWERR